MWYTHLERAASPRARKASVYAALIFVVIVIAFGSSSSAQTEASSLTTAQWHEDLKVLATKLPRKHANAFHFISREQFESEVADLDSKLSGMDADQIYVGMDRIVNSIGDGHTHMRLPSDHAKLPIEVARFGSDYRVVATTPAYKEALGARVTGVDDTPIAHVHDLLLPLTPGDETTVLRESRISDLLTIGMVLHGVGVSPDRDTAIYTVANDDGREFPLTVHSIQPGEASAVSWIHVFGRPPLFRQKPDDSFWYTYLADHRTVYCSFRGYKELAQRAKRLFELIQQQHPDKLVIDMRLNGGGDYTQGLKHLIHPIQELPEINRKGHLFVLVGAKTFSAAMSNAAHFRYQTKAILVGQEVGEKPNSYQEGRGMTLPNSHWTVRYSVKFYRFVKDDENVIRPDQEIIPSWNDYGSGRDPVLDWVFAYDGTTARLH